MFHSLRKLNSTRAAMHRPRFDEQTWAFRSSSMCCAGALLYPAGRAHVCVCVCVCVLCEDLPGRYCFCWVKSNFLSDFQKRRAQFWRWVRTQTDTRTWKHEHMMKLMLSSALFSIRFLKRRAFLPSSTAYKGWRRTLALEWTSDTGCSTNHSNCA